MGGREGHHGQGDKKGDEAKLSHATKSSQTTQLFQRPNELIVEFAESGPLPEVTARREATLLVTLDSS